MAKRTAKNGGTPAPYTKYAKRPFRYSEEYRRWRFAVGSGNADKIDEASADHAKKFGP